jgi:hypothetical protein
MDRLTWRPPNYYGHFAPKDGVDGMDCVQKLAAAEAALQEVDHERD